jgi:REP element-mobilizing transposase RayT
MDSTFHSLHHHVVFSTKERRPFIREEWCPAMHEYLGGIVRGWAAGRSRHALG